MDSMNKREKIRTYIVGSVKDSGVRKIMIEFVQKMDFEDIEDIMELIEFTFSHLQTVNNNYTNFINSIVSNGIREYTLNRNWVQLTQVSRSILDNTKLAAQDECPSVRNTVFRSEEAKKKFWELSLKEKEELLPRNSSETKIKGYITGKEGKPEATEEDRKLLKKHRREGLEKMQFYGVLDRLQTSGLI